MNGSALYIGNVVHQRHRPRLHRLEYRVFSLLLDLDELTALSSHLRLFAHNGNAIFSFLDRDHGPGDGSSLKDYVHTQLENAGIDDAHGPIQLLCYPRVLGYVFNPLCVYYCYRLDGSLRALLYEVGNTFGERHSYLIPVNNPRGLIHQQCNKIFYVSPFLPMDCVYHFRIKPPGERLSLVINETQGNEPILDAWLTGQRQPLTDANLLRVALQIPLLTIKVIIAIHWEAFRLWRKGIPLFRHTPPPEKAVSLITTEKN